MNAQRPRGDHENALDRDPGVQERVIIERLLDRVRMASTLELKKEIIVIDDCSTDGTREYLKQLAGARLTCLFHERNQGKGAALRPGLTRADGDVVLVKYSRARRSGP